MSVINLPAEHEYQSGRSGSSGKYHNIYQKGSSCQQLHGSDMLGRSVQNLKAECKCRNDRSAKIVKAWPAA
jgi:hypothetical protein